jgi:cytochrome c-type biogenesis protein CcmH
MRDEMTFEFHMLMFWIPAALLCVATAALMLAAGRGRAGQESERADASLEIYKDQLKEIDLDLAAGSLSAGEADAQRTEISRRLLAVHKERDDRPASGGHFPRWAVLAVPVIAAAIYWQVGKFGLADVPRNARLAAAETNNDWDALIARVELQLEKQPNDVEGWKLLVPNYLNMGRYEDAYRAMGKIAGLTGPNPDLYANMAEALVFANNGLMTAQSVKITREALKLSPQHPKALYYAAMGLAQEGKKQEALKAYRDLLALAPATAPWRQTVVTALAELAGPTSAAPQITAEQMQQGGNMAAGDRMAMIRGMVEGLDEKLKTNPSDVEGWLRLIRARAVLNEPDKARLALATARQSFAAMPEQLKLLDELAKDLSLQ